MSMHDLRFSCSNRVIQYHLGCSGLSRHLHNTWPLENLCLLDWQLEARQDTPGFSDGTCLLYVCHFFSPSGFLRGSLVTAWSSDGSYTLEQYIRINHNSEKIQENQEDLSRSFSPQMFYTSTNPWKADKVNHRSLQMDKSSRAEWLIISGLDASAVCPSLHQHSELQG